MQPEAMEPHPLGTIDVYGNIYLRPDVSTSRLPPGNYIVPPPPPREPSPPSDAELELFILRDSPEYKASLKAFNEQDDLGIDLDEVPCDGQAIRGGEHRSARAPFVLFYSPRRPPPKAAPGWYKIPEDEGAARNMWECTVRLEGEVKDRSLLVVFMGPAFFV